MTTTQMNDHACELCGWRGLRREREVNYSVTLTLWLCARCFHSSRYDDALSAQREPQRWL